MRELAGDASDDEIRDLLTGYAKRRLKNPVGYAVRRGQLGELAADLWKLREARSKTDAERVIDELRKGPPCDHGEPGGASLHPLTGKPLCPICRSEARASGAGIGVPEHSLSVSGRDLVDSEDSGVSSDSIASDQPEQAAVDSEDSEDSITPAQLSSWTAAELLGQAFPQPRWAVPGLIPEGVTLLAGPPKAGKSWLALGLCVAVASGGKALGSIGVNQGSALYLALEDTPRRLQKRLRQILGDDAPPDGLTVAVQCQLWTAGGAQQITGWLESHPDARLIVIDVFERIRGREPGQTNAYSADYNAVRRVKELADRFGVAIVLIHHYRKAASSDDDFLNEISGTLGLSGAADTIAGLRRSRGEYDAVFLITGRDVEENKYAMKFDAEQGIWQLVGLIGEYGMTEARRLILAFLREQDKDKGATPMEVTNATALDHVNVCKTMQRMAKDGQLVKGTRRGSYYLPEGVPGVHET